MGDDIRAILLAFARDILEIEAEDAVASFLAHNPPEAVTRLAAENASLMAEHMTDLASIQWQASEIARLRVALEQIADFDSRLLMPLAEDYAIVVRIARAALAGTEAQP